MVASLAEPTSPGELRTTFQGLLNLALTRGHASPTWSGLGPEPSLPSISWHMNIPTVRRTALRRRTTPLNTSTVTADCSSPPQAADAKPSVAQRRTPQGSAVTPAKLHETRCSTPLLWRLATVRLSSATTSSCVTTPTNPYHQHLSRPHASKATVITPLPTVKIRRTGCPVHIDDAAD